MLIKFQTLKFKVPQCRLTWKLGGAFLPQSVTLFLLFAWLSSINPVPTHAHESEILSVVVVGDTGIGERGYGPGLRAVTIAMQKEQADVILHLGDFVYQDQWFPSECPNRYIDEIRKRLVTPYPVRIFVAGDNDLPPKKRKPKASGCWNQIGAMATAFDNLSGPQPGKARNKWDKVPNCAPPLSTANKAPARCLPGEGPKPLEGTMRLGNALFVVLNVYDWEDPSDWLSPIVKEARKAGQWVIFALHEPALTTAWYLEKRQTVLKHINTLGPDLVLAGNQHSYERFHPIGIPRPDGSLPVVARSVYAQGAGVTHIVTGGGGATFKPFADQQGKTKRTAPKTVFNALAKRSLMFHYLTLEISHDFLTVQTYRVCPPPSAASEKQNPRWHADDAMWNSIALECDGQEPGVTLFDQIEIRK